MAMAKQLSEQRRQRAEASGSTPMDVDPAKVAPVEEEAAEAAGSEQTDDLAAAEAQDTPPVEDEGSLEETYEADDEVEDEVRHPFKIDGKVEYLTTLEVQRRVSSSKVAERHLTEARQRQAEAETRVAEAESMRADLERRIARVDDLLKLSDVQEPNWQQVLTEEGNDAYLQKKLAWDQYQDRRRALQQARDEEAAKADAERQAKDGATSEERMKWAQQQATEFVEDLRAGFRKQGLRHDDLDKRAQRELSDMLEHAVSRGYERDEAISAFLDKRQLGILRDAMAYRKLQSAKPGVTKKVREAAPSAKATVAPESAKDRKAAQLRQLEQSLQQMTGRSADARARAMAQVMKARRELRAS